MASLLSLSLCLLLTGCGRESEASSYSSTRFLMGTVVSIEIHTNSAAKAVPTKAQLQEAVIGALHRMEEVEAQTNRYEATGSSDCQRIAEAAGTGTYVPVREDLYLLLDKVRQRNHPLIDLSLGPLIDVWDKARESETLPASEAVAEALGRTGMDKVLLSREVPSAEGKGTGQEEDYAGSVMLTQKGMSLDFGAVAKGYAVEKAWDSLRASGLPIYGIINAGGNIKTLGQKPDGSPWKIGITDPMEKTQTMGNLTLDPDEAVATSGDYQKYFEVDGVRYHHLLEPVTGYPGMYNRSVLIVASDGFDTDYYSTLLFLMPAEEALALAEKLPEIETIIVSRENQIYVSSGLKRRIEWTYQGGYSIVTP